MKLLGPLAFIVVLLSVTLATTIADASCVQENLADQVARADVVAYGTVSRPPQLPIFPPAREIRFRVERVLKGIATAEMNVAIGPAGNAATSVDYRAEDGTAHTLYLRRTGNAYSTDACSGSHPGAPTAEETALLGSGGVNVVSGPAPASGWTLPVSVAILVALIAGAAVLIWSQRTRIQTQGR